MGIHDDSTESLIGSQISSSAGFSGGRSHGHLPLRLVRDALAFCLALAKANRDNLHHRFAACVLVSDNESWISSGRGGSTAVMTEWQARFRRGRPPKLVRLNPRPHAMTQAPERGTVLNVGGSVTPCSASWPPSWVMTPDGSRTRSNRLKRKKTLVACRA